MANINITSDAWTEISITSGTVQNISATADIELSAEQTDNSGVVLKPSEIYQWDNETIYARAVTEETGALRVVNFKKATGGGGGYVLPVASASTLGGVKVGSNLSIDADGVLSAVGGGSTSYSTTEQVIGTWIDGKPLYKKVFVFSSRMTVSYNSWSESEISFSSSKIKEVIYSAGFVYNSTETKDFVTAFYPLLTSTNTNNFSHVAFQTPRNNTSDDLDGVILQYTKTTD